MEKFVLNGGIPLRGEVSISGAKNAVVAILPATILAQDVCVIENIPNISDVYYMTKILEQLGARIKRLSKSTLEIDTKGVNSYVVSHDMTKHLRASYYFIGAARQIPPRESRHARRLQLRRAPDRPPHQGL